MENQHKQIKGYRDLSQEEIDLINKIKALAEQVGELVEEVEAGVGLQIYGGTNEDCKWVVSGKKDLQLGFMMLTRAVAKPTTF